MKKIILKAGKEQSVKRFHPWIFSGAIDTVQEGTEEGECVRVYSSGRECLGIGHYQPGSIAVRMLSFRYAEPSSEFWKIKFEKALKLRIRAGLYNGGNTNVFRLVNGEGDGFPGLIADFYNDAVVLQPHSAGMYRIIDQLTLVLKKIFGRGLNTVYCKSPLPEKSGEGERKSGEHLIGDQNETIVNENGNRFRVNWVDGQKTGFFIDQRDNRSLLQRYSADRRVLNMFGYTGGFSVYALRGGANSVHTVDSSARAIGLAGENIEMNFPGDKRNKSICSQVFDFFSESRHKYDIIILDPPAYAKNLKSANNALQAYKRLNARAMEFILPGGMLFTFSCSQVVTREQFRQAVFSAALQSAREIRIVHHLSQPADHPVNIYHPEGEYLKGLVLQIF